VTRPSLKLTFATLLGTLAYLGIAIIGWGGVRAFFAEPARVALAIVVVALTVAALFSGGNLSPGESEDRGNRWVLAAFAVLGLLGAYLPAYCERHGIWLIAANAGGDAVRWLGVALSLVGGVLRLWPVFVLGYRFSGLVAIQPGHRLVTDGIYSVIRHPSYLGLVVASLGWGLAFRSCIGVILTLLTVSVVVARIRAEEKFLQAHFGAEYERYRARTSRLIPRLY
jgi:protein-S-isoprenylcysteine O-methyltransferase Ste14